MQEPAHILVIDDDAQTCQLCQHMFSKAGYRVSLASSGEECLAYLQLVTPDLILLDLVLPDMDGQEVTRRIKSDMSKPFIPIIIISGHADREAGVMSLDAGADDFLVKPFDFSELLARVRAMLRLQRAQRGLRNEQQKTELLLHLTRELGASIELDTLLTRFLDHLADAVGAVRASMIMIMHEEDNHTICYSSSRNPATTLLKDILRQGVAGWVFQNHESLIITDTREDDRWLNNTRYRSNVRSVAAMPVVREGQVLAVITLVHHTPGYFHQQHIELLSSVAAQSAIALENAQLFRLTHKQKELLERRADELRRLNEISSLLTELMQPEQLMRLVAYTVHQLLAYPQVNVFVREGMELVLHASVGSMQAQAQHAVPVRLPLLHGLNGWAVQHQQAVCIGDVYDDQRFVVGFGQDEQTRSELILPIILRGEVLGTLDVRSSAYEAFGANDVALLATVVGQMSIALGNAFLLENEQRRIGQLNQMNKLSVAITEQLDAMQNLQLAVRAVAEIFGVHQAGLFLLGVDEVYDGVLVALHGRIAADEHQVRRFVARISRQGYLQELYTPRIIHDVAAATELRSIVPVLQAYQISSLVVVPMFASTRVVGLMVIDTTAQEEHFDRADMGLATTIASLVVQVIDNARLYRAVEDERGTLNAVLRGAADPILLIGANDELLLANRAAEEQFSLHLATYQGRPLRDLGNGQSPFLLTELLPLLAGDQQDDMPSVSQELVLPDHNRIYSVSVAPVHGADGQPLGRVAVLQDISAIKELERQERERVRGVFRRYVSPVVAEHLLSSGQDIGKPTECDVAVLFADLRGFTTLTERVDPHILIEQILNRYFTAMTEMLYEHNGTIDKFLGDGIIGVFGTPIAHPNDPQRALHAAVDMQRALARLSDIWQHELDLEIGMGIGISYGRAVVGNIGSEQRLDYTLIGDVVNTASRLSGVARAAQIIVSHHLYQALPTDWRHIQTLRPLGRVALKGKQEPHLIYEVVYDF